MYTDEIKIENKSRNSIGINIIGFILITMAGWIDTVGVRLFVNERSSSMTGRGHILGYWAYKLEFKMFMGIVLIILSFIAGALISTLITKRMGLIGGLFFSAILIIMASLSFSFKYSNFCTIFIPMAMGCQNAATCLTKIKNTTHLTGGTTEIGINIARGNWNVVRFWMYRWIGFLLGTIIGFNLVNLVNNNIISAWVTLIIPAVIIILTGIIQNKFLNIPLLD